MSAMSNQASDGRITPAYLGVVVILMIMLGGALPSVLFVFSQYALWIVWALFLLLITILSLQLGLARLIQPAMPLMVWLTVYVCWGILAAVYPIFESGFRLWFRFLCIIASMAIVTSHSRRLAFFANAAQWTLAGNLAVTALLIWFPEYQAHPFFMRMNTTLGSDRFAGLWGDANQAGLVALFLLVLSHWAGRWMAWIGRISGVMIIYLTASRTAFWIAIALAMYYLIFVTCKNSLQRMALALLILTLLGVGFLTPSLGASLSFLKENPTFARVFDLSESKTKERGESSRLDLAKEWLPLAAKGPWFGYGLYSSEGDTSIETKVKRGFPTQGTHNLYLALFIDAGWVGLLLFLLVILLQLIEIRRLHLAPAVQRTLFSLCFVMLAFSLASHQMVTDFTGWMGFALIFLLPMSPALNYARSI